MSMSVRSDDSHLEWAGALGLAGPVPHVAQRAAAVVPADADGDPPVPPDGAGAAGLVKPDRRRSSTDEDETLALVPRARRVLAAVPHPLHGVAGRLRVVLRPGGRAGLPGALPVQLPPAPRHAADLRVAAVAHRHRRFPRVRRQGRRRASPTYARHQGDLGARDPHRRGDHRRQRRTSTPSTPSSSPPTRTRRSPCSPSPPRCSASVLTAMPYSTQHRAAAHRPERAAPQRRGRGRRGTTCAGRPTTSRTVTVSYDMTRLMRLPVAADGRRFIVTLGGEDIVDQSQVIETMEYAHPIYTPASVAAQRRLPRVRQRPGRLRRRLARLGLPRGRRPLRGRRGGRAARRRVGPAGVGVQPLPVEATTYATTIRHTRRKPFQPHVHAQLAHLAGRPRPPARPRRPRHASRRATTSATPTVRSRTTSSTSSPSTAWRPTAAAS